MRKVLTLSLQIAFLLAICCSAFTTAHADIVPWLTGQFVYLETDPSTGPMYGYLPGLPNGFLSLNVNADLTYVTFCTINDTVCVTEYSGPILGGTGTLNGVLSPFDPNATYNMTVDVLGGYIDGYIVVTEGMCCYNHWQNSWYNFEGIWNTGWTSVGNGVEQWNVDNGLSGTLYMTTQAPEPASLALFGSGVLGLAGVLRRRLSV